MRHLIFLGLVAVSSLICEPNDRFQAWGFDAALLEYGGSFGGIWQVDMSPKWSLIGESDWTFVQTGQSFEYYDPYTGNIYKIGNQNLSLFKVLGGISWYPFAETMDPSFQFGFFGATGPILAMDTDNQAPDITRWRHVKGYQSIYSKVGLEFKIRQDRTGIYLLRVGYDFTKFNTQIDDQSIYQGVFLQVGMEFPRLK